MRKRRNMSYRPSKGVCLMGGVVGVVFVLIGIFNIIPKMGLFGILWTALSGGLAVYYFFMAFGKGSMGTITVEEEDVPSPAAQEDDSAARLSELKDLYDQRLITQEEYEAKREEILKEL